MLNVMVDAEISGVNGDVTWTQVKLAPSDDPDKNYIDIRVIDYTLHETDSLMLDPAELRRALDVLASERSRFMAMQEPANV